MLINAAQATDQHGVKKLIAYHKLNQYIEQRFGVEGDWIKQKLLLAQPAQDEILTAIREIASDRKLNYVFDNTAEILVLHSEKKYDISDLVIRYLEIEDKKKGKKFCNKNFIINN